MALKSLLTVDIEGGVTAEQLKKFDDKLKSFDWKKMPGFAATYKITFPEEVSKGTALIVTKCNVKLARREANIPACKAAVNFEEETPSDYIMWISAENDKVHVSTW